MNVAELQGHFFLDTNLLVYTFDATAQKKQKIAREIVAYALTSQRGMVSSQVVQEFLNVALRRFAQPMSTNDADRYLQAVLLPMCRHFPSIAFYRKALMIQTTTGYSWYDALILTAAIESDCRTLLSEDMQHGQKIEGVTLINPFR